MTKNTKPLKGLLKWLDNNMAIIVAVLFVILCVGLIETVKAVINKTFISITSFGRNVWLDCLFILFTIIVATTTVYNWFYKQKKVSSQIAGLILVICSLYAYFRLFDRTSYLFTCYWNGPVAYLDCFALIGLSLLLLWLTQQLPKKHNLQKAKSYSFNLDAPIEKADSDLFNLGSLVNRIVSYIAYTDVSHDAFSIGIVGEWGDGKSSLMNLVEERIKTEHQDFIVVHFFPRTSKKADFVQEDYLEALKQSLKPFHSGVDRIIDNYAIALDVIPGMPLFVSKLLSIFQVHINKNVKSTRSRLKQAIKDIDRRIVVLVDDLDRLTGEELIEVMKVLDKNGAFPNMVFLTSYDKEYVNTVLTNHLKLGQQRRPYTDKYFTVEVKVPLHPTFRLTNYLVLILREACESRFITSLNADVMERRTRQMEAFLMPRLLTIRDIKRFSNQFLYDYAEVQHEVNYQDFLLLELIKYSYPEEYQAIHRFQYIHRGSSSFLTTASADLIYLNKDLLSQKAPNGTDIVEPDNPPKCLDILRHLFPSEDLYQTYYRGRYQRIGSSSSFEFYFYNYEYSHLTKQDIDSLFNASDLAEACKMIDVWKPFSKDLETYLLTRDVWGTHNKDDLRKYLQFLLYAGYCYQSMNYDIQGYVFLRKADVTRIIRNCNLGGVDEYKSWLKDGLDELFLVSPIIPSLFIRRPIIGLFENNSNPDPGTVSAPFVFTVEELQDYALALLKRYLEQIDGKDWSAPIAFLMSHIQWDESKDTLPAAVELIHDSMVKYFERYSSSIPIVFEQNERVFAGFNLSFLFNGTFRDKEEFERIINDEKYKDVPSIDLIKAIWPIYKANGFQNFALPKDAEAEEAKKTLLKDALKELERYETINRKMDNIAEDWKKGHRLKDVDSFISRANELRKELNDIEWWLKLQEVYSLQLDDMINQFQEYVKTARNLDATILRVGDFIRVKDPVYQKVLAEHPDLIYGENIFIVGDISDDDQIITREAKIILSFDKIEAVLIDGKEDAIVYYDPIVMASYVEVGQPVPVHETDYSYYMDHFKRCYGTRNMSYYDLVEQQGFQFVHEVQHWLMDEMHENRLMLNRTFRGKEQCGHGDKS